MARGDDTHHLVARVRALGEAADLCEGRVDDEAVANARRVIEQTDRRLAVSGDATVVALAGATGSGKSSTFNALSGTELAKTSVRRPTTSRALACSWGDDPAEELLDWLEVPRRHALEQDPAMASALDGLVLLDLPDHDSTELNHRAEVDRLVQLVDMLIWVVDPQKYADAALHDRYLKPYAKHADVMMVVLNQADKLSDAERDRCLADLRRLLGSEGLARVDVMAVSALTGYGVDALRRTLAKRVAEKKAAARRLAADVAAAANTLAAASGDRKAAGLSKGSIVELNNSLATAAGVPVVADAVEKAWRLRGSLATGWPAMSWLAKFKPDPLRRLHLDRLRSGSKPEQLESSQPGRTSLALTSGVPGSRVDGAVRALADSASNGLSRGWRESIKAAARSHHEALPDLLDRAIATTDLDLESRRGWWRAVRVLQWLLVIAVVVGLLWLGSAFVLAYLQLPPLPKLTWGGFPAPTVLVIGGVIAGLVIAGVSRIGVIVGAKRRARKARQLLRQAIAAVTRQQVVEPVTVECDRYEQAQAAIARAQR